jgi:hypothetical protein
MWMEPADDARHVPIDGSYTVSFSDQVPTAAEWAFYIEDVPGTTRLSPDRRMAEFVPDAPLEHRSHHRIVARVCEHEVEHTFKVASPPIPLSQLADRTWQLPLAELTWLSPSSAGVFAPMLDLGSVLLETHIVEDRTGGRTLEMRFVMADPVGSTLMPRPCVDPRELGQVDLFLNPVFSTAPIDIAYPLANTELVSPDTMLIGAFEDDGQRIVDLELVGLIDIRAIESLLPNTDVCETSASLGEPCEPCPDGTLHCLQAVARIGSVEELEDYDLHSSIEASSAEAYCP